MGIFKSHPRVSSLAYRAGVMVRARCRSRGRSIKIEGFHLTSTPKSKGRKTLQKHQHIVNSLFLRAVLHVRSRRPFWGVWTSYRATSYHYVVTAVATRYKGAALRSTRHYRAVSVIYCGGRWSMLGGWYGQLHSFTFRSVP